MKNYINTFEEFLNEREDFNDFPKPMSGLKYKKVKAGNLKIGDEISDGENTTWEIGKVISINPIKLEVAETIIPKNNPRYKAPGTMIDVFFKPSTMLTKIIR